MKSKKIIAAAICSVLTTTLSSTAYSAQDTTDTFVINAQLVSKTNKNAENVLLGSASTILSGLKNITGTRTAKQTALLNTFTDLLDSAANTGETSNTLNQISPKRNGTSTVVTRKSPTTVPVKGIGKRLSALRKSSKRFSFQRNFLGTTNTNKPKNSDAYGIQPGLIKYNTDPALEAGGLLDQRLSGFVTANNTQAKQSNTSSEAGFNGNTNQLTVGADYRINNQTFAGAAFSYVNGNIDLSQGGGLDNQSNTLLIYATRSITQNWFTDATINFGKRNFEMNRSINFTLNNNTVNTSATSAPEGNYYGFSLGTGYDLATRNGHNISLLASFNYSKSQINAFKETGASAYALAVNEQTIVSQIIEAGIEWRQAISLNSGVLIPQISAKWNQELQDSSDAVNAYFIADPNQTTLNFETGNNDLGYMSLLIGGTMVLPRGLTAFAQFETQQFIDDYQQTMVSIGGRKEF